MLLNQPRDLMAVPIFTKCLSPPDYFINLKTYADNIVPRGPSVRAGNNPRNVTRTRNRVPKVELKIDG